MPDAQPCTASRDAVGCREDAGKSSVHEDETLWPEAGIDTH